jgi:hypothetical protein
VKYQGLLEYVLLVALAVLVAVKVYGPIGQQINATMTQAAEKLEATVNGR